MNWNVGILLILWFCSGSYGSEAHDCPRSVCNCTNEVPKCIARNASEFLRIKLANFRQLDLTLGESINNSHLGLVKFLPKLRRLYLSYRVDDVMVLKLVNMTVTLEFLSLNRNCSNNNVMHGIFRESNVTYLEFRKQLRNTIRVICSYERIRNTNMTCNDTCFSIGALNTGLRFSKPESCICKIPSPYSQLYTPGPTGNTSTSNMTNLTNGIGPKFEKPVRHYNSTKFSIILGSLSLIALLSNFIILAKMCKCQGQSVSKIFGMSMMLFNILLAEYGIALAVYLTQEDGIWNKSFCQVMTAIKLFAILAVIFALLCLTFQWSINPPDDNYNKQDVRFKAIVYILEGFVLAGMTCVLAWTKFDNWGYLCVIYRPVKAAEKIIVGVEYCFHCLLFLLAIRFPYKTLRPKEPAQSYIKMKYVVEREHPVFGMVVTAFLFWSVPFFVTIPATGLGNVYLTPLIRNCALMAGALVLPFLFVIRNTRVCCSRHTACGVNDPRVCQCKGRGSEMCYACEVQHKDMITNCEFHSFGDRRKSMSLDDLKFVLGVYKKQSMCNMKIKKKKLISRSFPVMNMDTIEEADAEDITNIDINRLFLGNAKNFELSIESPRKKHASLSRENTTSMPNLSSPKKLPAPGKKPMLRAKLSLSPRKSALLSPVKKSLEKRRAASMDTHLQDRNVDSSASDRSTTSSPIKSDNETNSLLSSEKKLWKRSKKKSKSLSKSKESVKSKASTKSKESSKSTSKNKLEVETLNTDSSGPTSPNRVSRIPSFIPLTDAGSSDSLKRQRKKSTSSVKNSPAKSKVVISKSSPSKQLLKTKDDDLIDVLGEDPNRVPSRGPTFFLVGDEDELSEDAVERPLIVKEKKAKRGTKKQRRTGGSSKEGTPLHEVDGAHGSRSSLEWDPSYSLSDSSCSSPIDEFSPPQPAPPPSNYALERVKEMGVRQPDSPHVSIGRGSSYSMDWDPTGIQIRHSLVSPCDWEPYSVDEVRSTITSPEDLASPTKINRRDNNNSNNADESHNGATAPLATADI